MYYKRIMLNSVVLWYFRTYDDILYYYQPSQDRWRKSGEYGVLDGIKAKHRDFTQMALPSSVPLCPQGRATMKQKIMRAF